MVAAVVVDLLIRRRVMVARVVVVKVRPVIREVVLRAAPIQVVVAEVRVKQAAQVDKAVRVLSLFDTAQAICTHRVVPSLRVVSTPFTRSQSRAPSPYLVHRRHQHPVLLVHRPRSRRRRPRLRQKNRRSRRRHQNHRRSVRRRQNPRR